VKRIQSLIFFIILHYNFFKYLAVCTTFLQKKKLKISVIHSVIILFHKDRKRKKDPRIDMINIGFYTIIDNLNPWVFVITLLNNESDAHSKTRHFVYLGTNHTFFFFERLKKVTVWTIDEEKRFCGDKWYRLHPLVQNFKMEIRGTCEIISPSYVIYLLLKEWTGREWFCTKNRWLWMKGHT